MQYGPDIVVTKPDSPEILLAVEVTAGASDVQAAETGLKTSMIR
jgi:hypothetical protein